MAGTPQTSRVSGGGGSGTTNDDCDLRFRTTLASPNREIVAQLSVDERLTLRRDESGGYPIVVAETSAGLTAGTIVDQLARLLECLLRGRRFTATVVKDPDGGVVVVDVKPG